MNKQKADELIVQYLPKIYGFAMKKAFSYEEAEELSSDIVTQVYLSLLSEKEILNLDGYIWRISEHVYAKFVSSKKRREGISIDGMEIPDNTPIWEEDPEEELALLRREIAFLTQTRRQIVYSFYYQNKPISAITKETGIPEGTVKWHLNKARNDLKEGFIMERKIGKLGIKPIEANSFGHSGDPGKNGGPEYYLGNKLNLNIVYSVYHEPKTMVEIAEELGVTPVYIEDTLKELEANGFLVKQAGNRYTTYVKFNSETYSLELQDKRLQKQMEIAEILVREYVPQVRAAIADVKEVYIPGGNRELLEAAAIFYAVTNKCGIELKTDLSKYSIKTLAGGDFIAFIDIPATQSDPDYVPSRSYPPYWACGNMTRWSEKYPSVYSWSIDTRYSSREGYWANNLTSDYEYLYEFMTGAIEDTPANKDKFYRLRKRGYLTGDNKVNIMVVRGDQNAFFANLPVLDEEIKRTFADYALEQAMLIAKDYPPQMRELIVNWNAGGFVGATVALMVMDILYENGTLRPLEENERITANLLMFCDRLPK
ncbi:MAG: sigma-70 family RNA polymerase sigma factor [Clostridia bacterium]|nr:sigma-70 family RNA polymerase sigma factor [Clostridia bacterium]